MGAEVLRAGKRGISKGNEGHVLRPNGVDVDVDSCLLLGFPKNPVGVQQRLDSGLCHLGLDFPKLGRDVRAGVSGGILKAAYEASKLGEL